MSRREIEREVERIMRRTTREGRRQALAAVPGHIRDRVRLEVEHRWKRRRRKE